MNNEVPKLEPGRLRAAQPPREQLDTILYEWIAGKNITYGRMFRDLMPLEDEVWELKTVDLRIFGWMYRPRRFIAVFGDYADWYKGPRSSKSYKDARYRVVDARNGINLDEPKYTKGTFDELVSI